MTGFPHDGWVDEALEQLVPGDLHVRLMTDEQAVVLEAELIVEDVGTPSIDGSGYTQGGVQ